MENRVHFSYAYERTVDLAQRALALHSDFALGLYALDLAACQVNRRDHGIEVCGRLVSITNRAAAPMGILGYTHAFAGRSADAQLLLEELAERSRRLYVDPMALVLIHAGLGDRDNVERQLEHLIQVHGSFAEVGTAENSFGPTITLSETSVHFENQSSAERRSQQPVVLTNTSDIPLSISGCGDRGFFEY